MRPSPDELAASNLTSRESLAAAVRELNLAAGTTTLDAAHLAEATAAVTDLVRLLGQDSTVRVPRGEFLEPREQALRGKPIRLHQLNPTLPPFEITIGHDGGPDATVTALVEGRTTGLTATADLTVDSLHEGPTDSVHGGTLSFLLDCILGVLVQATGVPSVTGTLDVRYLRRTPLDQPLKMRARIVRRDGRKVFTHGFVEHAGVRTAEAFGLFIAVRQPRT